MGRGTLGSSQGVARQVSAQAAAVKRAAGDTPQTQASAAVPQAQTDTTPAAATTPLDRVNLAIAQGGHVSIDDLNQLSDNDLANAFDSIATRVKTDGIGKQQDLDTQRFFNALGWTEHSTDLIHGSAAFKQAAAAANAKILYHADKAKPGVDPAKTTKQYMSKTERQFLSSGIHGDGTYYAETSSESWSYGRTPGSAQIRSFLNSKAKVIDESILYSYVKQFKVTRPIAYNKLFHYSQDYQKTGRTTDGILSIIAAMHGYNVIKADDYYTVLDRSATTTQDHALFRDRNGNTPSWR